VGYALYDKSRLQGVKVVVYRFRIRQAKLAPEIIRDGFGRERVSYVIKHKFDNPFKEFHVPYFLPIYGIPQDRRSVDVADDTVTFFFDMDRGKTAPAAAVRRTFPAP
jgi:hypothetical protein